MNCRGRVKEEYSSAGGGSGSSSSASSWYSGVTSSSYVPQPVESLKEMGPPPFLSKTYDLVEDSSTSHIVSWSRGNNSFVVWDPQTFSMILLPRYFKHSNFSSFVRQLNTYGFRKVDPERWEFANEGFLRGKKHLLKNIRRRKTTQSRANSQQVLDQSGVEAGSFGLDDEVARLARDKQILMVELVRIKQQQGATKACLQLLEQRIIKTENKQKQMMGFLARAMQSPNLMQQLVQQKEMWKEVEEAIGKKRRQPVHQGSADEDQFFKIEPGEDQFSDYEASELERLAMNMQRLRGSQLNLAEARAGTVEEKKDQGKDIDHGFWEELLKENGGKEMATFDGEIEDGEDVDLLVEQLAYQYHGSNPKY